MTSKMRSKLKELTETHIAPDLFVKDVGRQTLAVYKGNVEES